MKGESGVRGEWESEVREEDVGGGRRQVEIETDVGGEGEKGEKREEEREGEEREHERVDEEVVTEVNETRQEEL